MTKRKDPKDLKKRGRKSTYTPQLGKQICDRMVNGESLLAICTDIGIKIQVVLGWRRLHPEFNDNYAIAKEDRATVYNEKMNKITEEVKEDKNAIMKATLQVNTLKWQIARMNSKEFGDKVQQEISGADGKPLEAVINIKLAKKED